MKQEFIVAVLVAGGTAVVCTGKTLDNRFPQLVIGLLRDCGVRAYDCRPCPSEQSGGTFSNPEPVSGHKITETWLARLLAMLALGHAETSQSTGQQTKENVSALNPEHCGFLSSFHFMSYRDALLLSWGTCFCFLLFLFVLMFQVLTPQPLQMNHNAAKSNLATRMLSARTTMSEQARLLRRARHLYVSICRKHIITTETINLCANRMIEAGLYSKLTGVKSVRFSILRMKWKMELGRDWHGWIRKNGWAFYTFEKAA